MKDKSWLKNLLFLSLLVGSLSALTAYLMAADRIQTPNSFSPKSKHRVSILDAASKVDMAFQRQWDLEEVETTTRADNLTIARRLAIGLAGTIPSVEEIRRFEEQPNEDQLHWWISRLLEDPRTSSHLAERFARALVGVEGGPFLIFRRRKFVSWLSDQIKDNRKYDKLVYQLLTDEGIWTDQPSVNFFTRTIPPDDEASSPDPILLAARTSRAFLGMRIDCLQCHDDFLGSINLGSKDDLRGGTQHDFHALAAFFSEMKNSLLGIRDSKSRGPYEYKLLDQASAEVIDPQVPFLENLDGNEKNLRRRLARWVTHKDNRPFARAVVNRVWAITTGRGLIQPVDDIPLAGPFPEGLEALVDDFVDNDFDLHRLIRIIASTKAFTRQSTAEFEVTTKHEHNWAVFPTIRMRPEQVAGAISQSTKLTTIDSTSHIVTQLTKFGEQNDFVERFGDPGEEEFQDRGETVTQRLLMLNGNMIAERLENPLNTPLYIGGLSPNTEKAIETIYLSTLTRRPTPAESQHFAKQAATVRGKKRNQAMIDLYWTLINCAEFRWNH